MNKLEIEGIYSGEIWYSTIETFKDYVDLEDDLEIQEYERVKKLASGKPGTARLRLY
jgi:hypothetical protein